MGLTGWLRPQLIINRFANAYKRKSVVGLLPKKIKSLVQALPQECGIDLKISATADCS
ncbi:hypothetical protein CCACVL1_05334, partial [Corchorus capsularis]